LVHTGELLPPLVGQLESARAAVIASSAPASIAVPMRVVAQEQAAIWEQLKKMGLNKTNPTPDEMAQADSLKREQSDLENQTQQLRKKLQQLSQKTASLSAPLMHAVGQAASHMHDASDALSAGQAPSAQQSQEQSLDELRAAQDGIQQAQAKMMEIGSGEGGSSGSGASGGMKVIARPGGSGGPQGSNNGKVRLPTAADYRPPKAFREDLLQALKERYPKTYEDIIRQYYKRLAN
jgi:hypothetical protein